LQPWLRTTIENEPDLLLQTAPPDVREHLSVMLIDELSTYPNVVLGCPVQCYAVRTDETPRGWGRILLPNNPADVTPTHGLTFTGWMIPYAGLPFVSNNRHDIPMSIGRVHCLVAMFRVDLWCERDLSTIPPEWWEKLFEGSFVNMLLTAHSLYPLPVALEVGRVLHEVNRGTHNKDTQPLYITPGTHQWACGIARKFHEDAAPHFVDFDKKEPEPADADVWRDDEDDI